MVAGERDMVMKCKRIAAAALLMALLLTAFATGCSGLSRERLFGESAPAEETGEAGSLNEIPANEQYPDPASQGAGAGTSPGSPSAAQSPEADSASQPPETGQAAKPPASETASKPPTTWPILPESPEVSAAPVIPVEAITLSDADITMDRHSEHMLGHTVLPEDATDKTVTYITSNKAVATVSNDGVVYAAEAGSAIIKCVSASGTVSASCSVTVVVPVTSLSVTVKRSVYKTGETFSFSVSVFPEDATDKTYAASIDNTAAADFGGDSVTCISSGIVKITATAPNGVTAAKEITILDLAELADEVFRLTNAERRNYGLADFSRNGPLSAAAMVRAKESLVFFSHTRPDGRDCFSAFDENGVIYGMAAENIAYGQSTPAEVVSGWMNSPGHRANILNPGLGSLGVGVEMDENGRLYWSQAFTDSAPFTPPAESADPLESADTVEPADTVESADTEVSASPEA